ncbi:MAG TPA: hypothetical protein GX743_07080 [Actinomycetales bacterium]|nr:hypothetical protein [Actinomycetales bacterium]
MTRNPPERSEGPHKDGQDPDFAARWDELTRQLGDLDVPEQSLRPPAAPLGGGLGPRDYEPPEDDGAFVPPEPDIHLRDIAPAVRLGWFLLVVGIATSVVVYFTNGPSWVAILGGVLAVAGLAALLLSLPKGRDYDDDPGAVV